METTEIIQKKILAFLARYPSELFKSKELARRLGYRSEREYITFMQALKDLQDSHQLARVKGKQYGHLHVPQLVRGELSLTRQGYGFVRIEESEDEIFVPPGMMANAVHGDKVEVSLFAPRSGKRGERARAEGEVVRVVERKHQRIVGKVEQQRHLTVVVPDDRRLSKDIYVAAEDLNGARPGQKVVVDIESWGEGRGTPEGRVAEVLGEAGEVSAEIRSVAREYKLPLAFPGDVLRESESIPSEIPSEEISRRLDFREEVCFTIDPEDAKDFDDAVSMTSLSDGNHRLGVHIADVSYYVREGSVLDVEALKRGTSVYFPNGVIPMLPERLSNDLCSLRPNEDRLAFSVFMTVTSRGQVKEYDIRETVIRSKRRFAYEEVQSVLGRRGQSRRSSQTGTHDDVLLEMHNLSTVLTANRMKEGSIDFDSAEAKFTFDAEGKPTAIVKKVRLDAHRLVEEFMLLANKVVAQHIGFARKEEHPKPFLYRIHDSPDPDRIRELSAFVQKFGYKLNIDGGVTSKALQKLLHDVRGTEVENVINEVALRSMAKAVYSDRNIGHYGLAFDYYSHFTSPIRRYPDLVIHRLLKKYAADVSLTQREEIRRRLPYIAKQSSEMERTAMEAERAATKVMQVEFMKRHLGDEFQAVVSGVTNFGMFVEVNNLLVEGMIHVRDLGDDFYVYDEKLFALIGRRTKKKYRLGDSVTVKVVRVNPEERQIDFALVEERRSVQRRG